MTIKDIANLAGVSISTVSKIVNNKADNINIETRNRVLKIVKEYNYTPYGTAKNISAAKTFIIGVLLKHTSQDNLMLNGIINSAQKHGYNIIICDSMNSETNELKNITALCKHKIDGVIWEPVSDTSLQYEHLFKELNIYISYINTSLPTNSYCLDFAQMGYTATQKLIDYHHTHIACLMKPNSLRSELVFKGFKKCLFDNEIPYSDDMKLDISDIHLYKKIAFGNITGVLSTHFASALAFYEKADNFHYHIPSNISLVSLREDAREAICFPRISSIRIPYERFGTKICENLIAVCESQTEDNSLLLTPEDLLFDHEESIEEPPACRYKKIISIGSINTDITLNADDFPTPGSTIITTSSSISLGGKGANQAIGVAKLGREVLIIGKIGNDYDSTIIYDTLKKEHVLTQGLRKDSNSITGKAYIFVRKDAESSITLLPGANQNLTPQDIVSKEYLFKDCGYCLISTEIPRETYIQAVYSAQKHNVKTIVKPATIKKLPCDLLNHTDIFVPNRNEAALLCPYEQSIEKQAEYFYKNGCKIVIITLGHNGCYLKTKDNARYYSAAKFTSIDSTGGADAFISALAVYLTEGYTLDKSIKIASYAAGFCISRTGVIPALIDRVSLENHIYMTEPDLLC